MKLIAPHLLRLDIGLIFILLFPLAMLLWTAFQPDASAWQHVLDVTLWRYSATTLYLLVLVLALTVCLGGLSAWLIAFYHFPGHRWFRIALVLPLSIPPYIAAFTYSGLLEYAGPVQSAIRTMFDYTGAEDYVFPNVKSTEGAAVVLSLILYPYIYLIVLVHFTKQIPMHIIARTMQWSAWQRLWRIALPLSKASFAAGAVLVMMETLAEFGAVHYLAVDTLTVGVYRTLYNLNDVVSASRMGMIVLFIALVTLLLRHYFKKITFDPSLLPASGYKDMRQQLMGWPRWAAVSWCATLFVLAFIVPVLVLVDWSLYASADYEWKNYAKYTYDSFKVASIAALATVSLALFICLSNRKGGGQQWCVSIASYGYGVPGTILALGVLIGLGHLDVVLNEFALKMLDIRPGLLLSGSFFALIMVYVIRFMALSTQNISSGLQSLGGHSEYIARTFGLSRIAIARHVIIPALKPVLLVSGLLVFVESLKELSATVMIRPFNFETLATATFQLVSDERLYDAAPLALTIIGVAMLSMLVLIRNLNKEL